MRLSNDERTNNPMFVGLAALQTTAEFVDACVRTLRACGYCIPNLNANTVKFPNASAMMMYNEKAKEGSADDDEALLAEALSVAKVPASLIYLCGTYVVQMSFLLLWQVIFKIK